MREAADETSRRTASAAQSSAEMTQNVDGAALATEQLADAIAEIGQQSSEG